MVKLADRRNASCEPSGENAGFQLCPSLVSATSREVESSNACTSFLASCRSVYTIHLPSGENDGRYGSPSGRPLIAVERATPSLGLSNSSGTPLSYAVTTIVFPSGDHAGSVQSAPVDRIAGGRFVARSTRMR